jgi:hypothetical protein
MSSTANIGVVRGLRFLPETDAPLHSNDSVPVPSRREPMREFQDWY